MHCVSSYPTKDIDLNLLSIKFLKNNTNFEIGFSDHSNGTFGIDGSYFRRFSNWKTLFDKKGDSVGDFLFQSHQINLK